jgi:hypothetical protein
MVNFDQSEIAVRMMESLHGIKRPPGMSAEEAIRHVDPTVAKEYLEAAEVVFDYMLEQLDATGFVKWARKYRTSDEDVGVQ